MAVETATDGDELVLPRGPSYQDREGGAVETAECRAPQPLPGLPGRPPAVSGRPYMRRNSMASS